MTDLFRPNHAVPLRQPYPNLDLGVNLKHPNLVFEMLCLHTFDTINSFYGTCHWGACSLAPHLSLISLSMRLAGYDTRGMAIIQGPKLSLLDFGMYWVIALFLES